MSGNFGILANHVPMLAVLKPGVINIFETEGESKKYFGESFLLIIASESDCIDAELLSADGSSLKVIMLRSTYLKPMGFDHCCYIAVSSGTITVNDDSSVQILAEEAVTLDSIDRQVMCRTVCTALLQAVTFVILDCVSRLPEMDLMMLSKS